MKDYQKTVTIEAGDNELMSVTNEILAAADDGLVLDKIVRQDKYVVMYFVEAE